MRNTELELRLAVSLRDERLQEGAGWSAHVGVRVHLVKISKIQVRSETVGEGVDEEHVTGQVINIPNVCYVHPALRRRPIGQTNGV